MVETITGAIAEAGAQIGKSLVVVLLGVVAWWVFRRVGRRAVDRVGRGEDLDALERRQRAETLWSASRRVVAIALGLTVVLTLAVVWGIPIAPLLAVGSAVGVAVGFGAQSLVKDVIAGFFILAEDQFGIGDVIAIAGVSGKVEEIRLRVTVLRDFEGNRHYVPNGVIDVTSNLTQEFSMVVMDIGIAYREAIDRALEVLAEVLAEVQADPDWASLLIEPPELLGVEALGDSAVVLRASMKVAPAERLRLRRETLRRVKNRFDAEDIEIAFPHLTVYFGEGVPSA